MYKIFVQNTIKYFIDDIIFFIGLNTVANVLDSSIQIQSNRSEIWDIITDLRYEILYLFIFLYFLIRNLIYISIYTYYI